MKPDGCFQKPVARPPAGIAELQIFNLNLPAIRSITLATSRESARTHRSAQGQLRSLGVTISDTILDDHQNAVAACDPACGTDPDGDPRPFSTTLERRGAASSITCAGRINGRLRCSIFSDATRSNIEAMTGLQSTPRDE